MNAADNPVFDLADDDAYLAWREEKIAAYPQTPAALSVPVADPAALDATEYAALADCLRRSNFAIYTCARPAQVDKAAIRALGRQFGMERLDDNLCADEDSISSLQVSASGRQAEYIPYTNKPLSWHTDGYYNPPGHDIRAFIIHCASPAASGGENALLDPEMLYIALRDTDPAFIRALMVEDVMTIPANIENGVQIRPAQSGPVFSVRDGRLHMRYTARKRNIVWKDDDRTHAAVSCLEQQLAQSPYVMRNLLRAGQGIICANILHNRSGFTDDEATGQRRLMYRARYFDPPRLDTRR